MPTKQVEVMPYGDDEEEELVVTFTYRPGIPARTYGPPELCYPAEAAEYEIESATLNGQEIEINDEKRQQITDWLDDHVEQDENDGRPDADYLYDLKRDEEMMDV